MVSIKNKELDSEDKKNLCKTHNVNNGSVKKLRLYAFRNQKFIKTYHPLKQKKVRLLDLKFVLNTKKNRDNLSNNDFILSKKYTINPIKKTKEENQWVDEKTVLEWLISIGTEIKKISNKQYLLNNQVCSFFNILIFANRKRISMGLPTFYIDNIIEY